MLDYKPIVGLDLGAYQQAKFERKHLLAWHSDQVVAKFAKEGKDHFGRDIDVRQDLENHVQRVMKRHRLEEDSVPGIAMREAALDGYGLRKELEARGINPNRDFCEKFFVSTTTAGDQLFPAFLANVFVEARISAGLASRMCYADIPIDRLSYNKVRFNETADDRELRNVGIGEPLPLTEVSYLGTTIQMRKYGRRLQYAREVVASQPIPVIQAYVARLAREIAVSETDECLHILHAGDGETGSAVTDTTPAVDGSLDYADLVTLELAFGNSYAADVLAADATSFQTILNMAEFKDPLARRQMGREVGIPYVPTPSGIGRIYRWSSTRCSHMAETGGRVAGVDSTGACYIVRYGDLLEEQDTIIASGRQEVAISYLLAVVKGDPNAFHSLDVTA